MKGGAIEQPATHNPMESQPWTPNAKPTFIEWIDGKSDAAVSRMAAADLGFDVSPSTITGIRTSDKNPLNWNPAVVRKPAPIADTVAGYWRATAAMGCADE